jgi:hypothetical protein
MDLAATGRLTSLLARMFATDKRQLSRSSSGTGAALSAPNWLEMGHDPGRNSVVRAPNS